VIFLTIFSAATFALNFSFFGCMEIMHDHNVEASYLIRIIERTESDGEDLALSHSVSITKIVILGGKIILWQKK